MDEIFHKTTSVFDVVSIARPENTPHRYDKNGQLIISYLDTEEHRRRSVTGQPGGKSLNEIENKERSQHNEGYKAEGGFITENNSEKSL